MYFRTDLQLDVGKGLSTMKCVWGWCGCGPEQTSLGAEKSLQTFALKSIVALDRSSRELS